MIEVSQTTSEVKNYPSVCMICSRKFGKKFVCTECGRIVCSEDVFKCRVCGRQVCRDHTFFKRRFLILSEEYCPECALKLKMMSSSQAKHD